MQPKETDKVHGFFLPLCVGISDFIWCKTKENLLLNLQCQSLGVRFRFTEVSGKFVIGFTEARISAFRFFKLGHWPRAEPDKLQEDIERTSFLRV